LISGGAAGARPKGDDPARRFLRRARIAPSRLPALGCQDHPKGGLRRPSSWRMPMARAYWIPRCPSPPMPWIATRSPARALDCR